MKKKILNGLLFGAMFFGTVAGFTSCKYDDDDLQTRVRVVEGSLAEINSQIATLQAKGLGVKSASKQSDGSWVLVLSDDSQVTIGAGGGGTSVTVTETANAFIITVGGTEYALPKGAAACQLIYYPQYEDGIEVISGGAIDVKFYVNPKLENLDGATIDINEAHELKTRASSLFSVEGSASISGDIITIPIMATEAVSGKSYAVQVIVSKDGKDYISNFFTIQVGANEFKAEDLEDYGFAASITDAVSEDGTLADGSATHTWIATLPADLVDDFSFASFFSGVPADAVYEIASQDKQVGNAAGGAYDVLKNSLKSDGSWSLQGRPGCAFPEGFLVNIKQSGTIKMKVKFIFNDPLADVDFEGLYAAGKGGHIEIKGARNDGSDILPAGVNDIDLPLYFTQAFYAKDGDPDPLGYANYYVPVIHDGGRFLYEQYTQYTAELKNDGDIIYHDGEHGYVMGDVGQRYAKNSKGIWWTTHQFSFGSSNRRNLADRPGDEGSEDNVAWCGGTCNGELGEWDGIPGSAYTKFGVGVHDDGHFVTTENYKGWCCRAGIWVKYQYAYGEKEIGGGALIWIWCNRRACPEGVNDYEVNKQNPDNADLN